MKKLLPNYIKALKQVPRNFKMLDILTKKNSSHNIDCMRKEIAKLFMMKSMNIKDGTVTALTTDDLVLLFQLYDQLFFENWFRDFYKGKMKFSLSKRMTKSAGLTICPKNISRIRPGALLIEIRIGVDFFIHYGLIGGKKTVCGFTTTNSLEALQLVLEHELCHVLEFIHFEKSSCKGKRFKTIAANLFGHTQSYHGLPTTRQIARQKFGLKIGDKASFDFQGQILTGVIVNINKRATVMVKSKNGNMVDNKGNRYLKYYVPLNLLK